MPEKIRFVGRGIRGVSLSTYVYPYPLNESREIFKGRKVGEKGEKEKDEGREQKFRCVTGRKTPCVAGTGAAAAAVSLPVMTGGRERDGVQNFEHEKQVKQVFLK